jgi:hypothetical protein
MAKERSGATSCSQRDVIQAQGQLGSTNTSTPVMNSGYRPSRVRCRRPPVEPRSLAVHQTPLVGPADRVPHVMAPMPSEYGCSRAGHLARARTFPVFSEVSRETGRTRTPGRGREVGAPSRPSFLTHPLPARGPNRRPARADRKGLQAERDERMFDLMDRFYELENWRRSLVMLPPGSLALDREDAVALIAELQEAEGRLRGLRDALKMLLPMEGD